MNKQKEIKRTDLMRDLLEMVKSFEVKIKLEKEYIKAWASPFGEVPKSEDRIETYNKCIDRLITYYNKVRLK